MAHLSPNNGGCWFCQTDDDNTYDWNFSTEWDSWYHDHCYQKALTEGHPEAEVIFKNERR
jgi:hypothetical protein